MQGFCTLTGYKFPVMFRRMITTIKEFIKALGGTEQATAAFGVSPQSLCNWQHFGYFPAWAASEAEIIATKRNLAVDRSLFQISKWGTRAKARKVRGKGRAKASKPSGKKRSARRPIYGAAAE